MTPNSMIAVQQIRSYHRFAGTSTLAVCVSLANLLIVKGTTVTSSAIALAVLIII